MKAMVFAAGLGTRLKPVTDSMPKALVPVCGKPLLAHVLEKLAAYGYDDIVVNVHHFSSMILDYLAGHDFGVRISISDESGRLLETGGGILNARELLDGGDFLVHNVDIISDLDLSWFRAQHKPEAVATLLVSPRETQRYLLFDDDMRLVGWTNVATGEVRSPFPGLDIRKCRRFAFSGIHYISPGIFDLFGICGFKERFPIMDFYLDACARYPIYGVVPESLTLVDVGKLDSLAQAEKICASLL